MKTLILSCSTGEGHNSCAKAIKEYYDSKNEICIIKDGLRFISPAVSNVISHGHTYIYRHAPYLFRYGYRYYETHSELFRDGSTLYKFFTHRTDKLYAYICEGQFEAVICTHVFAALMLTEMLKLHPMKLATCFVSTDYTCYPTVRDTNLDCYFIPSHELAADFAKISIPKDKIITSGIPVRQMFYSSETKELAKIARGIAPNHKHLIMMCGSMGCGPIKILLYELSDHFPPDWDISVICGSNQKLRNSLQRKYADKPSIHILGYVSDMGTIMDSADLYLSKPGGISVTEAMAKALPVVFIDAVAGCEDHNRQHYNLKVGIEPSANTNRIIDLCLTLMKDDAERNRLSEKLRKLETMNSSKIIYDHLKKLTEDKYGTNRTQKISGAGC